MRRLLCLFLIAVPLASLPAQQRLGLAFKRPKLAAGVDTNDARAYLNLATREIDADPETAASGFYWAARLDPGNPEALYGLSIAHLMRKPQLLKLSMEGGKRARANKDLKAFDSLDTRASRIDPFLFRQYDASLIITYNRNELRKEYPNASVAEINQFIIESMESWGPNTRGRLAYAQGRLEESLRNYTDALKKSKYPAGIHLAMGRVHMRAGHVNPALDAWKLGIDALRKEDADPDEEVVFYSSKALVEHGIGVLYQKVGKPDSAKAALGRSMTEDLAYFMAHVALGQMALGERDSVTAVSELGLAAEIATDEPWVQYLSGSTLVAVGQYKDAIAPLKKANELEPLFAAPYFSLAQALEKTSDAPGAKAAYTKFLALAPKRDDVNRTLATQRLAALGSTP